jgi:type III pantothenate kinase
MILCIDSGNTRVKLGLGDEHGWQFQAALPSNRMAEGLPPTLANWPRPLRAVGCNVAGTAAAAAIETVLAQLSIPLTWLRSSAALAGVRNGYDSPGQLGADRWAALIGAHHLHAGASLVVSAGTATTIDAINANGVFLGGLILPGLSLMRSALANAAAQLPEAKGRYAELPRNTDNAIASGAIEATTGAIERMFRHVAADFQASCLLTGGAAGELEPHLGMPLQRVDDLVLRGLMRVAGN